MRTLTVDQFVEELDDMQSRMLAYVVGINHGNIDQDEVNKLLEGQVDHIHQIVYGVIPSLDHKCGHMHYGLKLRLRLKRRSAMDRIVNFVSQQVMPDGSLNEPPPAYSTEVESVIVFDTCDEYDMNSGKEKLLANITNNPLYVDN